MTSDRGRAAPRVGAPSGVLHSRWDAAFAVLMAAALLLVCLTFRDYGITWDEMVQRNYGHLILNYYTSLFADQSANTYINLYNYGGFFDFIAAIASKLLPFDEFEIRHLLNALIGLLGVAGTWKLGRVVAGPRAGFLAAALLLTIPSWYGHMFNNPKDIPFATFLAWGLADLAEIIRDLPSVRRRRVITFGIWTGLSCAIRVGAAVLFFYLMLVAVAALIVRRGAGVGVGTVAAASWETLRRLAIPSGLIAYAVMLPFWPYAQLSPILNPLRALLWFADVPDPIPVQFAGRLLDSTTVPPDYLPLMLGVKLPELTLALFLLATGAGAWRILRGRGLAAPAQVALLALAVGFPLGLIAAYRSNMFDGIRHVLFVLPPIVCAAALALEGVIDAVVSRGWGLRGAAAVVFAGYAGLNINLLAHLHPYESVYYNSLAGGLPGAAKNFDLDYWANSFRDDSLWLIGYLRHAYGPRFMQHHFRVVVCGPDTSVSHFLPPNFTVVENVGDADFVIALNRAGWQGCAHGPILHRVERFGVILSEVIDQRRQLSELEQ